MINEKIILEKLKEFVAYNDGDEATCDLLIAFVNQIGVDTSSLFPEIISEPLYEALDILARKTKMDCWFSIIQRDGKDYFYDLEDGKTKPLRLGFAQLSDGIDEETLSEVYPLLTEEQKNAFSEWCEEMSTIAGPFFAIGEDVVFDCKGADSEYKKYDGQVGKIIRILTNYEVDIYDVGNMYELRLENGETFNAFEDELSYPDTSVKPTAETYPDTSVKPTDETYHEAVVVIEDGILCNVYSTLQNLTVQLIDKDVLDSEALKDVNAAMDETIKRLADGELFSIW